MMTTAGGWHYATSDLTYDSNLWYNIVIVRELTSLKIYVDGNLTGSNEVDPDYHIDEFDKIRIGSSSIGEHWDGLIDELSIWEVALTEEEIQNYFGKQKKIFQINIMLIFISLVKKKQA